MKNEKCPCTSTDCARHGDCQACRAHHDGNPFCERQKEQEEARDGE